MPLTSGINHLALVTADLDRLIDFYVSVFDAEVVADLDEGGLRHAMVDIGGGAMLHPFEARENVHAVGRAPIFDRGHLDHVALDVADAATFEVLRSRLVACGASDGTITDFGRVRTVSFVDPDGWEGEVAQWGTGEIRSFEQRVQEPLPASR